MSLRDPHPHSRHEPECPEGAKPQSTTTTYPSCPYLPPARQQLDWRTLHAHRHGRRGADFYRDCLEYAQVLWHRRLAARALLCVDRAFGADLSGDEAVLQHWPMPYAATAWLIAYTPPGVFIGNPRVHFQHYAGRMNAPRREQRRARAWACWALTRTVRPELPSDPRHVIAEPTHEAVDAALRRHGHPGEWRLWREVLDGAAALRATRPLIAGDGEVTMLAHTANAIPGSQFWARRS